MFRLAAQDRKLRETPPIKLLKAPAPRKGFLEHESYTILRDALPYYLKPLFVMAYWTGMRRSELLDLRWDNVNLIDAQLRLDPGSTKNDEPRVIPLAGELLEWVKLQHQRRNLECPDCDFVFFRQGRPIRNFRKAWESSCAKANLKGLLFHDLRRTGVRNLVRAGVSERVAMAISGHKTREVFERYNIVSERDLAEAASKLERYLAGRNGDNSGTISDSVRLRLKQENQLTH